MASKAHLNQIIASHLVELKADKDPGKEVYIFERAEHGHDVLTYADMHTKGNKLARLLLDNGIGKGDAFIVYMRNYPEFIYSLLAATTIGAVAVPVDPRVRGDRLAFMINNSGAKAIVGTGICIEEIKRVLPQAPEIKFVTIAYQRDEGAEPVADFHALNETLEAGTWQTVDQMIMDVRQPWEVIYTSGTTGDPKGVTIRCNRMGLFNIVNRLAWKYKKDDVLYTGLSLTHGNAQAVTLFPALNLGIKAVFSTKFTKSRIWDICREFGCTSYSLLGGMISGIHNEPPKPNDADNPVKVVISAGTPAAIWEDFEKRFDVKILEWYGAVEGGFAFKAPGKGPIGSFGKPVPGIMEFKVVDEDDNEVPPGEKGELIARMLKGETKVDYLGLPQASDEKTKGGWLRTGDIVHKDADGWYYFDFRKGSELRRAGDFIQPERVEAVIGKLDEVSEVCVYGVPAASGAPGESDLVAAVAPHEGKQIDPKDIFGICQKELEANSIPSYLQMVPEVPKTVSQKPLDRVLKQEFEQGKGTILNYADYR